jgi:hypothetical protein
MKKLMLVSAMIAGFAAGVRAQDTTSLSTKDFETPTAPGFILLDKTPTIIERPNSSRAFALSVLNSFAENRGVPQNYAVEFTPFWFFRHPGMTALKYAGYKVDASKPNGYRQNIFHQSARGSVSAAFVTTSDPLSAEPVVNLSVGYRMTLIAVRSKKQMMAIKAANDTVVNHNRQRMDRQNAAGITPALKVTDPAEYNRRLAEFNTQEAARLQGKKSEMAQALELKPIFAMDGAVGSNYFFLENSFYNSHLGRFGVWGTMNLALPIGISAKGKANYLNVYGVGRYLLDGMVMKSDSTGYEKLEFTDVGFKAELEFDRLSFSYEYIVRLGPPLYETWRANGVIKYQVTDTIFLTGAFGKNFGRENNLISMLGINWAISTGNETAVAAP